MIRLHSFQESAMHYDATNPDHGMQYDPFKALVVPRPIGWISTLSESVAASIANGKDSIVNIHETKECTVCVVHHELMNAMNMSSASVDTSVNEFTLAELNTESSTFVKPPRVASCPAAFECKLWQSIPLPINDKFIIDGRVDIPSMQPVARLGYMDYAVVNENNMFELNRPAVAKDGKSATLDTTPWDGKYR